MTVTNRDGITRKVYTAKKPVMVNSGYGTLVNINAGTRF